MLTGKRFRLKTATVGIEKVDDERVAVLVPADIIIEVTGGPRPSDMHATGKTGPPSMPIFVPTPNHSHVVDNSSVNTGPIWWEVRPVLVMFERSGITSSKTMDDVEAAGRAVEVGSNFFLFFSSRMGSTSAAADHVMNH